MDTESMQNARRRDVGGRETGRMPSPHLAVRENSGNKNGAGNHAPAEKGGKPQEEFPTPKESAKGRKDGEPGKSPWEAKPPRFRQGFPPVAHLCPYSTLAMIRKAMPMKAKAPTAAKR